MAERLELTSWLQGIRNLRRRARNGKCDHESLVRHGFHLCQLTPIPLQEFVRPETGEREIETFLEAGAFASAALALVGWPMRCAVERIEQRLFRVEVRTPGQPDSTALESASLPAGIVAAWCECLLALERRSSRPLGCPIPFQRDGHRELH